MYTPTHNRPPAIVVERQTSRRLAGFLAVTCLGAAMMTGVTQAAFTDGEYGATSYTAGQYNLQIAAAVAPNLADTVWQETSTDGLADNFPETGVTTPIALTTANGGAMIPGLADSYATTTLYIRNNSNVDSTLNLSLIDQTAAGTANAGTRDLLRLDIAVDRLQQGQAPVPVYSTTGKAVADLNSDAKSIPFVTVAAPGAIYRIVLTARLVDGTDQATTNAAQGGTASLWVTVKGHATA